MTKAAKYLGISYRSVLYHIEDIEKKMEIKVIKTFKGGKGGGGNTYLSSNGKKILKECKIINATIKIRNGLNEIKTVVSSIDKDMNMMKIKNDDCEITLQRRKEFEVGDNILALINYESIFIMLEPCKSTVRNILKGTITEMKLINNNLRIKINIGNVGIYCDITRNASDDLELELGKEVYIGFKAMSIATLKL
jgi:molybdate transport system regulatory protein